MPKCKFCEIIEGKTSDYIVWENSNFIALLDIAPAKPGHLMIIPKQHTEDIFDLDEQLYEALFQSAKKLSKPLNYGGLKPAES